MSLREALAAKIQAGLPFLSGTCAELAADDVIAYLRERFALTPIQKHGDKGWPVDPDDDDFHVLPVCLADQTGRELAGCQMTDDALSRAQELLDEVGDDPRLIHLHSSGYVVATIRELADALQAARAENGRLRSYKSLPSGMVWQDYYSPDDVCKIREQLDAEIERLRADNQRLREANFKPRNRYQKG